MALLFAKSADCLPLHQRSKCGGAVDGDRGTNVSVDLTKRYEWQGRQIAWERAGVGPAVVFCHGTPWSSVVWQPIVAALSDRYTVYLWDMPGYGRSSKQPDHPVDFGVQAEVLDALIRHWDIARPHVIAHDFGGAVSLRAHLVCGADIASLMLADVVAIPPSGSPFFRFVQDNPGLLDQLPGYIHRAIVRAYISNASSVGLRADDLDALVQPWTGSDGQPAFYRQIVDYDERYLRENEGLLGKLTVPVHIVWGEQDAWIPVERAHRLHALIPHSTLRTVRGSNHLIQYDAPERLMYEVASWLDRASRSA
jgi:pimeloyl-ACP methyl ester carboxylesterase